MSGSENRTRRSTPQRHNMMLRLIEVFADGQPVTTSDLVAAVCGATSDLYRRAGFTPPWIGYLAILDDEVVGTCSFKSPPKDNQVEIAYFTFPGHEGRGIGTGMALKLIEIARIADRSVAILAQTLPEENASVRILRKLGFAHRGTVVHPEDGNVWEWELAQIENAAT